MNGERSLRMFATSCKNGIFQNADVKKTLSSVYFSLKNEYDHLIVENDEIDKNAIILSMRSTSRRYLRGFKNSCLLG